MFDDTDETVKMLSASDPVATKPHKCQECGRDIEPGERYHVDRFVWEGEIESHKTCAHCMVVRKWLQDECGAFAYDYVQECLREHIDYKGNCPMSAYRMAVGMKWKWRTPRGKLLPIPKAPPHIEARARKLLTPNAPFSGERSESAGMSS
jgi:hypothetical protein